MGFRTCETSQVWQFLCFLIMNFKKTKTNRYDDMVQFYVVFFCEFGLLFGILFFPLYNDFLLNYLLLHVFYMG